MNIRVEQTAADMKKSLFHDHGDTLGWMLRNLLLVGLAAGLLYADSSITDDENSLKIQVGKLATLGLIGLAALLVYKWWRARSDSQLMRRHVSTDAKIFYELNDQGIVYGIENVWHKSYSWKLVRRIKCGSRSFGLEVLTGSVSVSTRPLATEQIQEAIDFFERTRDRIKGDRIENWLAAARGVEKSFGPWVRPADTSAGVAPPRETAR